MEIILTGEDGRTFSALNQYAYREKVMQIIGISEITEIWFRPSFGRRAGTGKNAASGFGESDTVIIGKPKECPNKFTVAFLESKEGSIEKRLTTKDTDRNKTINQLKYQFALKLALMDCIYSQKKTTYQIPIKGHALSHLLNELYEKATDKNGRGVGWMLKVSPSSPCLKKIIELKNEIRSFKLLATGFIGRKKEAKESTLKMDIDVFRAIREKLIPTSEKELTINTLDWPCQKTCKLPVK